MIGWMSLTHTKEHLARGFVHWLLLTHLLEGIFREGMSLFLYPITLLRTDRHSPFLSCPLTGRPEDTQGWLFRIWGVEVNHICMVEKIISLQA